MTDNLLRDNFKGDVPNCVYAFELSGDPSVPPSFKENSLSFMTSGDTDSAMLSLSKNITNYFNGDPDQIVEYSDMVAELINEQFPQFCMDVFNCPEERSKIIETGREVVSDKSLFLTKKRYIMHVINDEGDKVDKLKVMGVELIKSDTSTAIKTVLWEFVNLILDGGTDDELLALRDKTRQEWSERWSYSELATPLNTKSLQKVLNTLEATGSIKGAHYSARAALFWNDMCSQKDKPISAGEKIGLVYIKHPDSKYIGFPIDMQTPPAWWDQIYIDYVREWKSAEKKIENYLTVLGLDVLSRKKEVAQSMFGFGFG